MYKPILTIFICLFTLSMSAQLLNQGGSITIQAGATLVVEGNITNTTGSIVNNGTIEVQGDFINDATLTNSGVASIVFTGAGNSTFTSSTAVSLVNLTMNKPANATLDLSFTGISNMDISGTLLFSTDNQIILNGFDMTLGSASVITRSGGLGHVVTNGTGQLKKAGVDGSTYKFHIGADAFTYNPISVANTGGSATVGARVMPEAYTIGDVQANPLTDVVSASWEVTGGSALTVTPEWENGDEPSPFVDSKVGLSRWDDTNGFWDLNIEDVLGTTGNTATRSNVAPGIFAVGGESVMDYILLLPKVFLEGPYNSVNDNMDANLVTALETGQTMEPYASLGYTHEGLGGGETNSTFTGLVDWVFIEIRDGINEADVIGTCSGLLKQDGNIVLSPSDTNLKMSGFDSSKDYYVVVKHRNHLSVMSPALISGSRTTAASYDMINNDVYGTNGAKFSDSVYQMYSGDLDGNGFIDAADRNFAWNNRLQSGYSIFDCSLNAFVDAVERNITWNNRLKSTNTPN